MKLLSKLFLLLFAATSCSASSPEGGDAGEAAVSTSPETLLCEAAGGSITFNVTATAAFQAYAADDCSSWVSGVNPSYSAQSSGAVTVTCLENLSKNDRTGTIVIKCGTLRHKVALTQSGVSESPITCPLEGYSLVWHDEFDGSSVNTSNWKFENWTKGWVNNELQYYVAGGEFDGVQTACVADDILSITASKYNGSKKFSCNNSSYDISGQVISARMNTRSSWKYGYMEARISLPKGKGTWPAFWMMPTDQSDGWPTCGEIDIMEEVGVRANYTSSSVHTYSYNHTKGTQKTKEVYTAGAEGSFQIYACEWTQDYIRFYTNGVKTLEFTNDGKSNKNTWPFNKAFYITLNLAWGGDWGGMSGVDESALPCTMKVDYVRVFQK